MPAIPIQTSRGRVIKHNNSVMKITEWKQNILEILSTDNEISKLLFYSSPDVLSRDDLSEDEKFNLVNKQILGVRYINDVVEEQKSYIALGFGNFVPQESWRQFSQKLVMGYVYFYILVDNQIMLTDTGYRQDLLLQRIYDLFQDSPFFGLGRLQINGMTELWEQNNKFGGYTLIFRVIDTK